MSLISDFLNENQDIYEPIMMLEPENCATVIQIATGNTLHLVINEHGNPEFETLDDQFEGA